MGRTTVYGSAVASQRLCLWRSWPLRKNCGGFLGPRRVSEQARRNLAPGLVRECARGWAEAGRGEGSRGTIRGEGLSRLRSERGCVRGVNGTPHGLWCAAVTWTLAAKRCVEGSERDAPRFMCAICLCGSAVAALGMYLIGDRPSAGGRGGGGIRGSPRCLPSLLRSPSSRSEVV